MTGLTNQANAHTGFSLQRGAAPHGLPKTGCGGKNVGYSKPCGVVSYTSLRGGKRSKKRKRRRKRKGRGSRKRCGGSPLNRLLPKKGMRAMLTRGKNASRGLSDYELRTISGGGSMGAVGYRQPNSKINLYDVDGKKYTGQNAAQNGGGYGFNSKMATGSFGPNSLGQGYHLKATLPTTGYKNCGIVPKFKMGAGQNYVGTKTIQKGAGPAKYPSNQSMKLMSTDGQNQMPNPNYGYTTGKNASIFAPGHPQVTINNAHKQQCHLSGGRKKKGGNRFFLAMKDKVESIPGDVSTAADNTIGNAFLGVHAASGGRRTRKHRKKSRKRKYKKRRGSRKHKRRRRKRRTKRQRGGYAQYQSNVPLTWTQQLPAGAQGGTWQGQLATPPTYTRTNICHNNYDHYTGTNTPSPILDQAVMVAKKRS